MAHQIGNNGTSGAHRPAIIITGCSSGIGYAAAHALRRRGWNVFASCRAEADCERLRAEGFDSPRIDYCDERSMENAVQHVLSKTDGRIDALYNNGAISIPGALEDLPLEALRNVWDVNVGGPHRLSQLVIPAMRDQGRGKIITCSSVLGKIPLPFRGAYVSSKFALEGLTDALRLELRHTGIHVILLEPGLIRSKFSSNSSDALEKWVDVENSHFAKRYQELFLGNTGGNRQPDWLFCDPELVINKLVRALESKRPRNRYVVTPLGRLALILNFVLPRAVKDRILGSL